MKLPSTLTSHLLCSTQELTGFHFPWQPGREPPQPLLRAFGRISILLARECCGTEGQEEQDGLFTFNTHLRGFLKLGCSSRLSPIPRPLLLPSHFCLHCAPSATHSQPHKPAPPAWGHRKCQGSFPSAGLAQQSARASTGPRDAAAWGKAAFGAAFGKGQLLNKLCKAI